MANPRSQKNPMKNSLVTLVVIVCLLLMKAPGAQADVWNFTGSRYQAMGGTGVAFSDDSLSAHWPSGSGL